MVKHLLVCICISSSWLFAAAIEGEKGHGEIRVVPVERTPEPEEISTYIAFPEDGATKQVNPISIQIRIEGFAIGYDSDFPRAREIRTSPKGQTLHILVDDKPFIEVDEAIDDTADSEEINFDQTIEIKIPYKLQPGLHVLRVLPIRSFGESLKGPNVFASSYFYVGSQNRAKIDLTRPYLTYNQPQGSFSATQPVLLDFFISNIQLSKDGYKVRLTIDEKDKRILTEWVPYYIYGLSKGSHMIQLDLLDPDDKVIPPLFNDTKKMIRIQ